jgi:hypothetical protein
MEIKRNLSPSSILAQAGLFAVGIMVMVAVLSLV